MFINKDIFLYVIFFYLVCFSNCDSKNIILIIFNYNEIIKRFIYLFLIINILMNLWFVLRDLMIEYGEFFEKIKVIY